MRFVATIVPLALLAAVGSAAPAALPGHKQAFAHPKAKAGGNDHSGSSSQHESRFIPKKPLSHGVHINEHYTIPVGPPMAKPRPNGRRDTNIHPGGGDVTINTTHPKPGEDHGVVINAPWPVPVRPPIAQEKPPRDRRGKGDFDKDGTSESQDDCEIGSISSEGFCVDLTPINLGGDGPIVRVRLPNDVHPSVPTGKGVSIRNGGAYNQVTGGPCHTDANCIDGLICNHHKCTTARTLVARNSTIPPPLPTGNNNTTHTVNSDRVCKEPGYCGPGLTCGPTQHCIKYTLGNICKTDADCSPGLECVNHICRMPRGSEVDALANGDDNHDVEEPAGPVPSANSTNTVGHVCKEPGDCQNGQVCVEQKCKLPWGSEDDDEDDNEDDDDEEEDDEDDEDEDIYANSKSCQKHEDCDPGYWCIFKKCMTPSGSDALFDQDKDHPTPTPSPSPSPRPSPSSHVSSHATPIYSPTPSPKVNATAQVDIATFKPCKSIGDCEPGYWCIQNKCMTPKGSEIFFYNDNANTMSTVIETPITCPNVGATPIPSANTNVNPTTNYTLNHTCKETTECSADLWCIKGKCQMPKGSEPDALGPNASSTKPTFTPSPSPNANANYTLNHACKETKECSVGLWCIKGKCHMPKESEPDALGSNASSTKPTPSFTPSPSPSPNANSTLNRPCKTIGDCSPSLYCVNFQCKMPKGSEPDALGPKDNTTMSILPVTVTSWYTVTGTPTPSPTSTYASHTLGQSCTSIEDCSAGLFCIDAKCQMPKGSEPDALGPNGGANANTSSTATAAGTLQQRVRL
ncbi:hypothetical protein BDV19DRAFT_387049 [Aspergillus venezuelensis]